MYFEIETLRPINLLFKNIWILQHSDFLFHNIWIQQHKYKYTTFYICHVLYWLLLILAKVWKFIKIIIFKTGYSLFCDQYQNGIFLFVS